MVTSSFANSKLGNGEVKVLKDNENVRIVEGDDDKETIKMIVNKKKNTCEIIITKKSTKKTITKEIKLNSGVSNNKTLVESDSLSKSSANNYQKTYLNYEYFKTYSSPNEWELRRPDTPFVSYHWFDTEERDENREYLDAFADDVEEINDLEVITIASIGVAALMDLATIGAAFTAFASGGTLTPLFWEVAVASIGVNEGAAAWLYELDVACTSAFDNYQEALKFE